MQLEEYRIVKSAASLFNEPFEVTQTYHFGQLYEFGFICGSHKSNKCVSTCKERKNKEGVSASVAARISNGSGDIQIYFGARLRFELRRSLKDPLNYSLRLLTNRGWYHYDRSNIGTRQIIFPPLTSGKPSYTWTAKGTADPISPAGRQFVNDVKNLVGKIEKETLSFKDILDFAEYDPDKINNG